MVTTWPRTVLSGLCLLCLPEPENNYKGQLEVGKDWVNEVSRVDYIVVLYFVLNYS